MYYNVINPTILQHYVADQRTGALRVRCTVTAVQCFNLNTRGHQHNICRLLVEYYVQMIFVNYIQYQQYINADKRHRSCNLFIKSKSITLPSDNITKYLTKRETPLNRNVYENQRKKKKNLEKHFLSHDKSYQECATHVSSIARHF